MKHLITICLIFLFSIYFGSAYANDAQRIPERFQGIWTQDKMRCEKLGESYFKIEEAKLVGYESFSRVEAVFVRGNELALIAITSGEGESWLTTDLFELSSDGKVLIDKQRYPHVKRYRCP